jgi:hypothetical protein
MPREMIKNELIEKGKYLFINKTIISAVQMIAQ